MLKKILTSNLFWDFIIVLVVCFFFGGTIWGAISSIISVYLWMAVIGVVLGALLLWGCVRAMNPKKED
jgi:membrane associated rhomboid family serine protease